MTVAPAAWEGSVEQNPLVAHAVLIGEANHTPTLKLKRAALIARGHDIIESLYCDPRSHP